MDNSPRIQSHPYTEGFNDGYQSGNDACNPYPPKSKPFLEYEEGRKAGNRSWYEEEWSK